MNTFNSTIQGHVDRDDWASGEEKTMVVLPREPYSAPRVRVSQPSIQGGDIIHLAESQGGLWAS